MQYKQIKKYILSPNFMLLNFCWYSVYDLHIWYDVCLSNLKPRLVTIELSIFILSQGKLSFCPGQEFILEEYLYWASERRNYMLIRKKCGSKNAK